ncbi:hypothetical protein EV426DRAFT_381092 [Tirmania nivea]|nr:hypothetical protein EV426DRAFT_381092 [Tirmania nivea]
MSLTSCLYCTILFSCICSIIGLATGGCIFSRCCLSTRLLCCTSRFHSLTKINLYPSFYSCDTYQTLHASNPTLLYAISYI